MKQEINKDLMKQSKIKKNKVITGRNSRALNHLTYQPSKPISKLATILPRTKISPERFQELLENRTARKIKLNMKRSGS
jgi:hypothetical protein